MVVIIIVLCLRLLVDAHTKRMLTTYYVQEYGLVSVKQQIYILIYQGSKRVLPKVVLLTVRLLPPVDRFKPTAGDPL
jgi:hypothetical protein